MAIIEPAWKKSRSGAVAFRSGANRGTRFFSFAPWGVSSLLHRGGFLLFCFGGGVILEWPLRCVVEIYGRLQRMIVSGTAGGQKGFAVVYTFLSPSRREHSAAAAAPSFEGRLKRCRRLPDNGADEVFLSRASERAIERASA